MTDQTLAPTIHLNGTSAQELLAQTMKALDAVVAASSAVQDAAPNARDYYVQGPDAYLAASAQHRVRTAALCQVAHELTEIVDSIVTQMDARGETP